MSNHNISHKGNIRKQVVCSSSEDTIIQLGNKKTICLCFNSTHIQCVLKLQKSIGCKCSLLVEDRFGLPWGMFGSGLGGFCRVWHVAGMVWDLFSGRCWIGRGSSRMQRFGIFANIVWQRLGMFDCMFICSSS